MGDVLVTGASGFIGYHLVQALVARGDRVTCLVRKSSAINRVKALGAQIVYNDFMDRALLRATVAGKEVVYHVAGRTKVLHVREFFVANRDAARNMAEACASQPNPPVLVVVSSLAAAGPSTASRQRMETDPLRQVSYYARSKRAGELAVQRFADRVPITVLRPPIVLGEADTQGVSLFRTIQGVGVHLVPGWTTHRYSVIHATDLATAMILAAQRGCACCRRAAARPRGDSTSSRPRRTSRTRNWAAWSAGPWVAAACGTSAWA